jgi:nucleolar pre-ribosomal-associated protein 1
MVKRTATDVDPRGGQVARHVKRQRVENSAERTSPRPSIAAEEVTTPRQLEKVLLFDQGSAAGFRSGTALQNIY